MAHHFRTHDLTSEPDESWKITYPEVKERLKKIRVHIPKKGVFENDPNQEVGETLAEKIAVEIGEVLSKLLV